MIGGESPIIKIEAVCTILKACLHEGREPQIGFESLILEQIDLYGKIIITHALHIDYTLL